jgi:hypothetical protein
MTPEPLTPEALYEIRMRLSIPEEDYDALEDAQALLAALDDALEELARRSAEEAFAVEVMTLYGRNGERARVRAAVEALHPR